MMNIDIVVEDVKDRKMVTLNCQGNHFSKLHLDFDLLNVLGNYPNKIALDLLLIGSVVYAIDRRIKRKSVEDAWTRSFNISVPVSDPEKWQIAKDELEKCLNFLSGDKWFFSFSLLPNNNSLAFETISKLQNYNTVSLFSGGLDSLVGVINYLVDNPGNKIILVGHHDPHMPGPKSDQEKILEFIEKIYPDRTFPFFIGVGVEDAVETTLRSRSFLFISLGVFASQFLVQDKVLLIPENGTIALNVPLTPSRRGTCSTRTAHPHYLQLYQKLLDKLDISTILNNPFEMLTKGEVVESCKNPELLRQTAPISVSCGKRGHVVHWKRRKVSECGRCMPCIYRRAALHKIGLDNEIYGNDICSGEIDPLKNSKGANDLRVMLAFIESDFTHDIIAAKLACNGRLNFMKLHDYANMIIRTRNEIKQLLKDKAIDSIKKYSGILE